MSVRRAVYTVLMGGYEQLNHESARFDSDVDFLCLTDDAALTSDTWSIVPVQPALPADPVRSQRLLKIVGHPVLDDYDETLYVDNAVLLRQDPTAILDAWLADHDFALHAHSYRDRVGDEFDKVLELNYDDASRITEQLLHYSAIVPETIDARPLWTALLARRRTPELAAAMRTWADHVLRYSRRDQLSIDVALRTQPIRTKVIEADNFDAETHRWPVDLERRIAQGKGPTLEVGPILVERARAVRRAAEAEDRIAESERLVEATAQRAEQAETALEVYRSRLAELEDELGAARASEVLARDEEADAIAAQERIGALAHDRGEQLVAMRASTSWRVTAPLRAALRLVRGR